MTEQEARDELARLIARTMPGWSDDTMTDEYREQVNKECLRQGGEYADAILAAGYRKHPEREQGSCWDEAPSSSKRDTWALIGLESPSVERAALKVFADNWSDGPDMERAKRRWDRDPEHYMATYGAQARAYLEAALRVPVGEEEQR